MVHKKIIGWLVATMLLTNLSNAQVNITKAEYFIDADPGFGSAINIPVTAGTNIANVPVSVSISALSSGFHNLYLRSKDATGNWSVTNRHPFFKIQATAFANVTKAEYFIDTDPGFGNAINVPVTAGINIANVPITVSIASLSAGFHNLYLRSKDVNGNWSITNRHPFFKMQATAFANVTKAEYFIDTDPGFGNAINVPVTAGTNIADVPITISITSLSAGFHNLYVRSKDVNGNWSVTNRHPFFKIQPSIFPNITKAEYFIDTDPGFGNAINIPVTTGINIANVPVSVSITSLNAGFHNLYVRSKDVNGNWSVTNRHPFFKVQPSILANVVKAEYFLLLNGTPSPIPDFGAATPITISSPSVNISDIILPLTITPTNEGEGKLFIRTQDANGKWSITNTTNLILKTPKPGSGNAIMCNGLNNYVQFPNLLNGATQFTIEYWINTTESKSSGNFFNNPTMIGNELPGANSGEFSIYSNNGFIGMWGEISTGATQNFLSPKKINDGNWHHIAASNNGTLVTLYVDGLLIGTISSGLALLTNTNPFRIGENNPASIAIVPHQGIYDEVLFWNTALTQAQLKDRMCHKLISTDPLYSNLKAYYDFDETATVTKTINNIAFDQLGVLFNTPIRLTSGAPIGNASAHDYVNATKTTSITHPTGESFTATSSTGNPDGIHVYRVDEQPNTLAGTSGVGTNDKYFGVFQVNGTAPTYQAAYNYTGNPGVTPANEVELRLNKRTDNSSTNWATMPETANEANNTITVLGQSTEYILGKVGIALPLNLLSFTGSKISTDAQLQWITANEINLAKYELQRSDNGNNFVTVSTVLAGGTNYTFTDAAIFTTKQIIYYRLKMIDKDGKVTISNIIKLSNYQTITLAIYPNPVKDILTVSGLKQRGTLRLLSAEGKIIYQQIVTTQATTISMIGYAKGLYMLQYQYNDKVINEKLSKQ